jgi:hypothetical protein
VPGRGRGPAPAGGPAKLSPRSSGPRALRSPPAGRPPAAQRARVLCTARPPLLDNPNPAFIKRAPRPTRSAPATSRSSCWGREASRRSASPSTPRRASASRSSGFATCSTRSRTRSACCGRRVGVGAAAARVVLPVFWGRQRVVGPATPSAWARAARGARVCCRLGKGEGRRVALGRVSLLGLCTPSPRPRRPARPRPALPTRPSPPIGTHRVRRPPRG